MKINDFISVVFPQEDSKTYYAVITKMNADNSFDCRFVHSGSQYTFKQFPGWLEVMRTTGLFRVGSRTNQVKLFSETMDQLSQGSHVSVAFDDGKSYLGIVEKMSPQMEIKFIHSGNKYSFDADQVAHQPGSPYDGRKALHLKPFSQGRNLFSDQAQSTLSLSITDNFGKPLRGEFEARIKRTDAEEILYENRAMRAEDSHAFDNIELRSTDGQRLVLLLDFHPAFDPYQTDRRTSALIDTQTSVSGTKSFPFKSGKDLHFDIKINYDTRSVTSSSGEEAVRTVYQEVTSNKSHSTEVSFEGEASFELFGIGVSGGGGRSTTTESGSGSTDGESEGSSTTTSVGTTYNVYVPAGLDITGPSN